MPRKIRRVRRIARKTKSVSVTPTDQSTITPRFLDREKAAAYLIKQGIDTTEQGLADRVRKNDGPRYVLICNRALYTAADLDAWIDAQAAREVQIPRRQRRATRAASAGGQA